MVSQNNLTHIISFPDGARLVLLDPRIQRNVHAVTFYRYKMHHIFGLGHYNIFILKQLVDYKSFFLIYYLNSW